MARERLRSFKGILAGKDEEVWSLLRELRAQDEERLEKLQRSTEESVN